MYWKTTAAAGLATLAASPAMAQSNSTPPDFVLNTLFVAICAILVMWMAAGFTMLETGFVRAKNVTNQCVKNLGLVAVAAVAFMVVGHGFMFPDGSWMMNGVLGYGSAGASNPDVAPTANILYQMMFCAATASIVSGTLAERMRLLPFFIFTAVLTAIIYPIQASWSWGGGFLQTWFGFQDLAGGTVVHVVGGVAALTGALIVGARQGRYMENGMPTPMPGSNLPLSALGAMILWMGWFGFNAGSYGSFSSAEDAAAVSTILLNTNLASAGGIIGAALLSYIKFRQVDLTFMINGALAGLVAITAEPLFPSPALAISIGMIGGFIVVLSVPLLDRLKIDDVVGAIPVHLFCGIWGTIAVLFSNPDATFIGQFAGIAIVSIFVFTTTTIAWVAINTFMGIRVSEESERNGIDLTELGQEAYPEFAVQ